jgi:hypothetical protein
VTQVRAGHRSRPCCRLLLRDTLVTIADEAIAHDES